MSSIDLAIAPGDGIGTEVVPQALRALTAAASSVGLSLTTKDYDLGWRLYDRTGEVLPVSVIDELRDHDAILFGAVGDPRVPPGLLERGMLLTLRFTLDHHVNLRPVRLFPGMSTPVAGLTPERCDIIVVREGTEGPYVGAGGSIRQGTTHEVAIEESINTAYGAERVVRDAFARAMRRRRKVTLVHKANVLVHAGAMWQRIVNEVAREFPDVETEYQHVDAASMFFVTAPERYDVIVTDNLFGDIITDVGAAVAGGIGLAASGNIDSTRKNPSMFEPVHGSAPDIAGQGIADPTAAILSTVMLLQHLGQDEAAALIESAVAADLAERATLGSRSTEEVGDAIVSRIASAG
ncbi:MAG TPA: 3-isopropylmalate dehydrogenase [Actinobacteria bacterium]|nr:3-isopropylmalate dehydrogenase [Actinomycetota bacterium]